jgi:hypothetical protein
METQSKIDILVILLGIGFISFTMYLTWSIDEILKLRALSKDLLTSCFTLVHKGRELTTNETQNIDSQLCSIAIDYHFGDVFADVIKEYEL